MTIVIPKLVSLDIIDLNKRLRDRYKQPKQNLLDILPDDVMKIIIKYKLSIDFDDGYDGMFIRSKYNSLYDPDTIYKIANNIIFDKKWNFDFKPKNIYDDFSHLKLNKAKLDFVKNKLHETETSNFDYLTYFKRYCKNEIFLKKFEIGKTYYKSFKNKNTKETINLSFVILERQKLHFGNHIYYYDIIANISNTDVKFRSRIDNEYLSNLEDDNNIYFKECSRLTLRDNTEFAKYLKDNNLSVIRYNFDS